MADDRPPSILVIPKPILDPATSFRMISGHIPSCWPPELESVVQQGFPTIAQSLQETSQTILKHKLLRWRQSLETFSPTLIPPLVRNTELRQLLLLGL